MDRVGVLLVSKCLSAAAMVDALVRSDKYEAKVYMVERQANPFDVGRAEEHRVVPDLSISQIARFAKRFASRIDFGLCDTEDFVVNGGRDRLAEEAGVQMVCVTKKFAVEGSKAGQRLLFDRIWPQANPSFRVFDPSSGGTELEAVSEFRSTLDEMKEPVIKPDAPARGAGVGVWGSDFKTKAQAVDFFLSAYSRGRVVVEDRVEGEESSFHAFSDGKHFCPSPLTRDYKRARDGNMGRLTGGMGSYRDAADFLPFVTEGEWSDVLTAEARAFRKWKGRGTEPGLRGIVEYDALMHTGRGFKVLERNSRGGNTEFINLLTTLEDDLADLCFRINEGKLRGVRFRKEASVVTCVVPSRYGLPGGPSNGGPIELTEASAFQDANEPHVRVYPMDVRVQDGETVHGSSRCVAAVGVARRLDEAREFSVRAAQLVRGRLRYRKDVAGKKDIEYSRSHLERLRGVD